MASETEKNPPSVVSESDGESDVNYFSGGDNPADEYEPPPKDRQRQSRTSQRPQLQQQRENRGQPGTLTATQERPRRRKMASAQPENMEMQPFERAGPPATSIGGPVTYAQGQRSNIPMRQGNPNQELGTQEDTGKDIDNEEGLRLKLELNLDVEVELKASIHGDLTLALLS